MMLALTLAVIFLPFLGGVLLWFMRFKGKKYKQGFLMEYAVLDTLLTYILIAQGPAEAGTVLELAGMGVSFTFRIDGAGMVFAGLIAAVWPIALLYAFPYMERVYDGDEESDTGENTFYFLYMASYGLALGVALAGNLLTMYCFYELLALVMALLVLLPGADRGGMPGGRGFFFAMLAGAALAFVGVVILAVYGDGAGFAFGGVLDRAAVLDAENRENLLLWAYVSAFLGFGVQAGVFPFHTRLSRACASPVPVAALFHTVGAQAGAFAAVRLTYYGFGVDFLSGTWAQGGLVCVALFTVIYGAGMALKETHILRRFSCLAQAGVSAALFGVLMMTPPGFAGALLQMVSQCVIQLCQFFCAGAVAVQAQEEYVWQLDGMARKMPGVSAVFVVSVLASLGVPGFCGFTAVWYLLRAAAEGGSALFYVGMGALFLAAVLAAVCLMSMVVRMYCPAKGAFGAGDDGVAVVAGWRMLLPVLALAAAMPALGLGGAFLAEFFMRVANGLI